MGQEAGGYEPESLLRQCICLLSLRNFSSARKISLSARRSYPALVDFARVLTIASVHPAAQKRAPGQRCDWFSIVQLESRPECGTQREVESQVRKLLTLLNPGRNKFPFAQEAFELVRDAWSALSDRQRKTQFQNELKKNAHKPKMQEKRGSCEKPTRDGTFWTLCPYCYYFYEYEAIYEDCCLRCQNCRRAFYGVVVPPPEDGMVVEGKEQYYCGFGCFPLRYSLDGSTLGDNNENGNGGAGGVIFDNSFLDEKKGNGGAFKADFDTAVEISDDSDEDSRNGKTGKGEVEKHDGVGLEQERVKKVMEEVQGTVRNGELGPVMQGSRRITIMHNGKKVIRNVKSVARNTKKMMGTGKKYRRIDARENLRMEEHANVELGDGPSGFGGESGRGTRSNYGHESLEGNLESFLGDDGIYVGIKNAD